MKKLIAGTLVIGAVLANAEWKQDNIGWWNMEGSSWTVGWNQDESIKQFSIINH